ncbi:MAG: hypothetical protein ACOC2U_03910 [bacterium]
MKYSEKKKLFESFLKDWKLNFSKIPSILKYLSSYPEITDKLVEFEPINIEYLNNSQLEWISLVAQFDNLIETEFFKDYWVPIQKDGYDYFIDLSSDSLPLFEAHYFFFEPYRWHKKYIFKDLSQFLIDIDKSSFNIENHFKKLEDNQWSEINDFFRERDELGFSGKLELDPIEKDNLFSEGESSDFSFQDNCITINGINSVIVGLLPHDCSIKLENFEAPYNRADNVCEKVKNIKALVYLLQSVGMLSIDSYSIQFDSDKDCRGDYKDNTFKIIHTDSEFLKSLIDKYETYKNS